MKHYFLFLLIFAHSSYSQDVFVNKDGANYVIDKKVKPTSINQTKNKQKIALNSKIFNLDTIKYNFKKNPFELSLNYGFSYSKEQMQIKDLNTGTIGEIMDQYYNLDSSNIDHVISFSIKKQISKRIRTGLNFSFLGQKMDYSNDPGIYDLSITSNQITSNYIIENVQSKEVDRCDTILNKRHYLISGQFDYFLLNNKKLNLYLGSQFGVSLATITSETFTDYYYSSTEIKILNNTVVEETILSEDDYYLRYINQYEYNSFYISPLLGIEYKLNNKLSLNGNITFGIPFSRNLKWNTTQDDGNVVLYDDLNDFAGEVGLKYQIKNPSFLLANIGLIYNL